MQHTTVIASHKRSNPASKKNRWIATRNDGIAMWLVILLALFLAFTNNAIAQVVTSPRTEVRLISDLSTVTPSRPFWVVLHIKLKEGWHTYWKNPGDSGTPPMFDWTLPSGFKIGEVEYLAPERMKMDPLMDYGYHHDAYYLVPVKPPELVNENAKIIFMLKAQWLVCSKDVCIPEKGEFSLVMPVTPAHTDPKPTEEALLIDDLVEKLPTPLAESAIYHVQDGIVRFSVKLPKVLERQPKSILFFPEFDGVIANMAEQKFDVKDDVVSFEIPAGTVHDAKQWQGVVSLVEANDKRKDYSVILKAGMADAATISAEQVVAKPIESGSVSLFNALLFALLGGLILNLMPCVLPILSLKVLSVAKKAKSHAWQVRKQAFAYTAGVVLSFMVLAALLLLLQKLLGQSLGWGFQMQSPLFVSFLALIMFVVGLNLSGAFELPVLLGNVGSEKAKEDSASGSFLTGVLAVLVATPCTAPFMAPAIGFALTQSTQVVLMVFAALGLGLAAPFLFLSLFPSLVRLLPKPGAWMLTLRQFLAFPMYLTVVWLLWIVAGQAGPTGIGMAMLCMVLAGFCIFLLNRGTWLARILAVLLAVVIVKGMVDYIAPIAIIPAVARPAEEMTYSYSPEKLAELRKNGKPVFVYATAQWCITCKVNEAVALDKPEVKAAFKEQKVSVLVADWTNGDETITKYLQSFDRSGVPIYVFYPPNGEPQVLPQLLTPSIVIEAITPKESAKEPVREKPNE